MIGANPLATITALAERNCELFVSQNEWVVDRSPNGRLDLFGEPKVSHFKSRNQKSIDASGLRFTEVMEGYVHIGSEISEIGRAHV